MSNQTLTRKFSFSFPQTRRDAERQQRQGGGGTGGTSQFSKEGHGGNEAWFLAELCDGMRRIFPWKEDTDAVPSPCSVAHLLAYRALSPGSFPLFSFLMAFLPWKTKSWPRRSGCDEHLSTIGTEYQRQWTYKELKFTASDQLTCCFCIYSQAVYQGRNMWQRKTVHLMVNDRKRKSWSSHCIIQGHNAKDLRISKLPATSQKGHPGDQTSNTGIWRTSKILITVWYEDLEVGLDDLGKACWENLATNQSQCWVWDFLLLLVCSSLCWTKFLGLP